MMTRHVSRCLVACLAFALGALAQRPAHADDMPVIMTYELKKHRLEQQQVARDPKTFWIVQIVGRIASTAQKLAKPVKQPVTTKVNFVVGRDGHLVSATVGTSSGNAEADRAALEMLHRAQPFPPMPMQMSDLEMSFTVPIKFR